MSAATADDIFQELLTVTSPTGEAAGEVWLWWAAILVLIMHLGFAFLEAGSIEKKSALNVMFKNIMTITLGGVSYYFLGYSIFSGNSPANNFFGGSNWLLLNEEGFVATKPEEIGKNGAEFFFQFAFAATAATIVSGAVAGRIKLAAYAVVVIMLTSWQYPAVTHWVWNTQGWLTNFYGDDCATVPNCPVIGDGLRDFAGSGVVHMSGGFSALAGAIVLGPRAGSIAADGSFNPPPPSSTTLMAIGVFVLWIGWYGFNCGSTLTIIGYAAGMGHAAICTTLAPSAAILTGMVYSKALKGYYDLPIVLNSCLAGLVGITASANIMNFGWTIFIGSIASLVYIGGDKLLKKLKIDDPVSAIAVHGFAGVWGVLMVILSDVVTDKGSQFAMQLLGVVVIAVWNFGLTFIWFFVMAGFSFSNEKKEKFLRATAEEQEKGLDMSEHGGDVIYDKQF